MEKYSFDGWMAYDTNFKPGILNKGFKQCANKGKEERYYFTVKKLSWIYLLS